MTPDKSRVGGLITFYLHLVQAFISVLSNH